MKKLVYASLLAVCFQANGAFAKDDDPPEHVIVTPDPQPGPGTAPIGSILPGGTVSPGGGATLKTAAAKNARYKTNAKNLKESKKKKGGIVDDVIDWILGLYAPEVAVTKSIASDVKDIVKYQEEHIGIKGFKQTVKTNPKTGEVITTTTVDECSSGATTVGDAKPGRSCLELFVQPIQDADDGKTKYEVVIRRFEPVYDPDQTGYEVDAQGYWRFYKETIGFVVSNVSEVDVRMTELYNL